MVAGGFGFPILLVLWRVRLPREEDDQNPSVACREVGAGGIFEVSVRNRTTENPSEDSSDHCRIGQPLVGSLSS